MDAPFKLTPNAKERLMKRGTRYFLISSGECGMSTDEAKSQSGSAWVKAEDYEALEKDLEAARKAIREAARELKEEIRISNNEGGVSMEVIVAYRKLSIALKDESEGCGGD